MLPGASPSTIPARGNQRRPYAQAWHDDYGLLTNRNDQIILRLHTKADREALRQDMYQNPDKLMKPQGLNMELSRVVKHLSLSGALGIGEVRPALKFIDHGHPVLFLPHRARDPMVIGHRAALDALLTTGVPAQIQNFW